jgi:hypothetical protein
MCLDFYEKFAFSRCWLDFSTDISREFQGTTQGTFRILRGHYLTSLLLPGSKTEEFFHDFPLKKTSKSLNLSATPDSNPERHYLRHYWYLCDINQIETFSKNIKRHQEVPQEVPSQTRVTSLVLQHASFSIRNSCHHRAEHYLCCNLSVQNISPSELYSDTVPVVRLRRKRAVRTNIRHRSMPTVRRCGSRISTRVHLPGWKN